MSIISTELKSTEKSYAYPINPGFFMLSTVKTLEISPKHDGHAFISEPFALH